MPDTSTPQRDASCLDGRVALVTGGSRGLGREMVFAFAAAGAEVVITSRDLSTCQQVADQVTATGARAHALGCHVGHWDEIDALVEEVYDRLGRVDVLVNNAGSSPPYGSLPEIDPHYWNSVLSLNLTGPFRLAVAVAERMREAGGGSIINVTSTAATRVPPNGIPYAAAKAGLGAITVGLAQAYAPTIRVNALVPGGFTTRISGGWPNEQWDFFATGTAMGRPGRPEEVRGAAVFLASDASTYITGSMLTVDGGWT